MRIRVCIFALVSGGALGFGAPARAQKSAPQNVAIAESLFREGQQLFEAGKIHDACEKFAGSQRLDAALGTLINLATCHMRDGRTATAWSEFADAAAEAGRVGQASREKLARGKMVELERRLSRVQLQFAEGANVTDVKLDGQPLDHAAWQAPIPIDPGAHVFVFASPGKRTTTRSLTVAAGPSMQTLRVDVPEAMTPTAPTSPPAPLAIEPRSLEASDTEDAHAGRRVLGFVVGGVGILGVGLGSYFGLAAASSKRDADKLCTPGVHDCNSDTGLAANDTAHTDAAIATIAVGVGLAAVGVGTYLVLSSHAGSRAATSMRIAPRVSTRGGTFAVEGAW